MLEVGAPQEDSGGEWLCVWHLVSTASPDRCISKGVSSGSDALQSLLRALQVVRLTLDELSAREGVRCDWRGHDRGGLPDLGASIL
jgi:hypothetical protein